MKKFLTIVGTRPQLIKIDKELEQILVWTGQHYDKTLKDVFFKGLKLPKPDYDLGVTDLGTMTDCLIPIIQKEKPDFVIVYGDCRSTLAGAMAALTCNVPVIHIEAGCRSFNNNQIEERIRKIVDEIAIIHFCPSESAKLNIERHDRNHVYNVGATQLDTMFSTFPTKKPKDAFQYKVMTLHREENMEVSKIDSYFKALKDGGEIELYAHPRLLAILKECKIDIPDNIKILAPLPYKQMINRIAFAEKVITDSGGLQVETFFLRRPAIILRNETEWTEAVDQDWNRLATRPETIARLVNERWRGKGEYDVYGTGNSKKIIRTLLKSL